MVRNLPRNAGDTVGFLVREDSTCHRAAQPLHQNYSAGVLGPVLCNEKLEHLNED